MSSEPGGGKPSDHRTIRNADVPSETEGLPGAGDEASGAHYLRDTVEPGNDEAEDREMEEDVTAPPPAGDRR